MTDGPKIYRERKTLAQYMAAAREAEGIASAGGCPKRSRVFW